jgi:hypothetical protein
MDVAAQFFFVEATSVTAVIAEIRTNLLPRSFEAERVACPGCRSSDRCSVSRPCASTCSVSASCGRCFDAVPEPATRALYDRLHLQPGSVLVDAATEASTRAPTPPPPGRSRRSPSARGFERTGLVTSLAGCQLRSPCSTFRADARAPPLTVRAERALAVFGGRRSREVGRI